MSTTAEKLTYLNTTKQKIKDAINNIGGSITSETPFRQYVVALESIYQSMPKVSESGTSLSLSPTLKGLMQITLKGNTSQVQLSGKNKFNKQAIIDNKAYLNESNVSNLTANNSGLSWTATGNDSYVSLPATITGGYGMYIEVSENTTYTLSFTSNYTLKNYIHYIKSDYTFIERNVSLGSNNEVSFTTPTNCKYIFIRFGASNQSGNTINITNIQVEQGTTATTYEQYCGGTPSPNPSYPQDIHNVSGDNDIVVCGKNLFDKDTMVINSAIDAGNGNMTSSDNFRTAYIKCKPNTTYSISKILSNRFVVGFTSDKDLTLPKTLTNVWSNQAITTKTITSPNNAYYMFITLSKITDDTTPIQDILDSLQVEINETATTFEAYNGTTYPINLLNGMELCKIGTYEDSFLRNTGKNLFDGILRLGNYNTSTGEYVTNANYIVNTNLIPVEELTNYKITLNGVGVGMYVFEYKEDYSYNLETRKSVDANSYLTTNSGTKYINFRTIEENTNTNSNIMVQKGTTATSYEPYGNDEWYKKANIGKVVLNGSETGWDTTATNVFASAIGYVQNVKTYTYIGLCDYYKYNPVQQSVSININNNEFAIQLNENYRARLFFKNTSISQVSDFTTWLSNHNTSVYYVLNTPTYTKITDSTLLSQLEAIYNANSRNGTTNINQENNDLPFIIDVSCLKGA